MRRFWTALIVAGFVAFAPASNAGIFGKKPKEKDADRVLELVNDLKNSTSATKRAEAAEGLREFDGTTYPEIVPALVEALQKDSSSSVRAQAAESLGKLKPPSNEAAQALDQAVDQDKSFMVRFKARTARLGYRVPNVAKQPTPPPGSVQVKVPPPDASGHIKPVPIPSGDGNMATKPLPAPDADADADHVTLKPRELAPEKLAPLPLLGQPKRAGKGKDEPMPLPEGPVRD